MNSAVKMWNKIVNILYNVKSLYEQDELYLSKMILEKAKRHLLELKSIHNTDYSKMDRFVEAYEDKLRSIKL